MDFVLYNLKVAGCLVAFYLFYKICLSRETFHRFNRVVLILSTLLSFILPFCVITLYREAPLMPELLFTEIENMEVAPIGVAADEVGKRFDWQSLLPYLYGVGVFALLLHTCLSIIRITRLIGKGERRPQESGSILILKEKAISPFSWIRYIVMSKADFAESGREILVHEEAHIRLRHSIDLLLTDLLSCLQWFNPAVWLIKQELRAVHEYEADMEVINKGVDAKQYQLLLIKKAAGGRWCSVANSFNHSKLKNRITMMLRKKSSKWAGVKVLYLPLVVGVALVSFAQTVWSSDDKVSNNLENQEIEGNKIEEPLPSVALFTIVPTLELAPTAPQEEEKVYDVAEVQPMYPGGLEEAYKFVQQVKKYPQYCADNNIDGSVISRFIVGKDGSIRDIEIVRSPHEELSKEAERIIKLLPKWNPGKIKGEAVSVKFVFPIVFTILEATKQNSSHTSQNDEEIHAVAEVQPMFPGGMEACYKYLADEIKYPANCVRDSIQGLVLLQFIVDRDGSITEVKTVRSPNPELSAEAERVVKGMPKWEPGRIKGNAVRVKFTLPVQFRFTKREPTKVVNAEKTTSKESTPDAETKDVGQIDVLFGHRLGSEEPKSLVKPTFPGGHEAGRAFMLAHLKYPSSCVESNIAGQVFCLLDIANDGTIAQVKVQSPHEDITREVERVVKLMPKWEPGRMNGNTVDSKYRILIRYGYPIDKGEWVSQR